MVYLTITMIVVLPGNKDNPFNSLIKQSLKVFMKGLIASEH